MKNSVLMTKATYEDMHNVAQIIRSSAKWYEKFVEPQDLGEHYVDDVWKKKNYKKREFYLCHHESGEKIGTLSLEHFKNFSYLGYVYLDLDYVGHGYGQYILKYAKELTKSNGKSRMILMAHPEAKWAIKAYKKFGFKKIYEKKEEVCSFENNVLASYYEEGFHLYEFKLT
tara:strand:- start:10654 stop:11166 length:513 start_codon:yes stop_codon:yes gene_type:complete